jgi:MtN3 and saliva related transmembrane protein
MLDGSQQAQLREGDMIMELNVVGLVGSMAGICSVVGFVPQIVKIWRSRSAQDISLGSYIITCTGLALWLAYGVMIHSKSLIFTNIITLSLATTVLCMKIAWGLKSRISKK